jgi:hypothetical protein
MQLDTLTRSAQFLFQPADDGWQGFGRLAHMAAREDTGGFRRAVFEENVEILDGSLEVFFAVHDEHCAGRFFQPTLSFQREGRPDFRQLRQIFDAENTAAGHIVIHEIALGVSGLIQPVGLEEVVNAAPPDHGRTQTLGL